MGKIAFVFSGQGAQYSGMGKDLYEHIPEAKEVFDQAEAIRPGIKELCFSGSEDELSKTINTQPCMFALEMAASQAVKAAGIVPDMAAGFSLGEIAAITCSGMVFFEEGFRLVSLRGELMQKDAEEAESAMAAVLKLPAEKVEELCRAYSHVYPVNYNCPGQISVAGAKEELAEFMKDVKAAGGRAVPLKVKGGFHSPFMQKASEGFDKALRETTLSDPSLLLYSNYTGKPYEGDYVSLLSRQICNPVRWQDIVCDMIAKGADTFIEMGPGKTLCGLIAKIDPSVKTYHVEDCASLAETVREVTGC